MPQFANDSFANVLSGQRTTRRAALTTGIAAAIGLAGVATPATAQDATPEAENATYPMFLFVQLAEGGTWTQSADDPEIYELTLSGIGSQTAYFSDRPERIVGTTDTAQFLENLGFTPVNPPNAAAVVRTPEGERDVLVVELFDPVYTRTYGDDATSLLTYRARILDAYHGDNLDSWYDEVDDPELPSQFDQITLFIDDCPSMNTCVIRPGVWVAPGTDPYLGPIPGGPYPTCYNDDLGVCYPCAHTREELYDFCNDGYPACRGNCWAG